MKSLVNTKRLRSHYTVLVFAFLASLLSGCATIEGVGEDIESAGEAVEDAAEDAS
ncbi:entericidin A/B family lipoprotein [Alteromonas sp. H39]|uniref:entericidin A/B family lipoprotein n=1 Tax=Alteromonas sp. H39 TaxID=3389876 RepID=UPI0039E1730E